MEFNRASFIEFSIAVVRQARRMAFSRRGNGLHQVKLSELYGDSWWVRIAIQMLLVTLVGFMLLPLIVTRIYPMTHEAERYAILTVHFRSALDAGIWYPRWLPHLAGGLGYPTFCFYQPLFFFCSSLLTKYLQIPAVMGVFLAICSVLLIGLHGFYFAARHGCSVFWSLVATYFFALTPYLYSDLYVRGDLSELASIAALPWSLAFLLRLTICCRNQRSIWPSSIGVGVGLAAVIVAHPLTALAWFMLVFFMGVAVVRQTPRQLRFVLTGALCSSFLLALTLAMPYWGPFFQLKGYTQMNQAATGYYFAPRHVVGLHQFFLWGWGFGPSVTELYRDGMSFQLGTPHFLVALAGVYFGRKRPFLLIVFGLYLMLIFSMSNLSYYAWRYIKPLAWFQFPWRLLAVVAPLQSILIVGWADSQFNARRRGCILFAALFAFCFYWPQYSLNPIDRATAIEAQRKCDKLMATCLTTYQNYAGQNEFLPKTAVNSAGKHRKGKHVLVVDGPNSIKAFPDNSPFRIHYSIEVDAPQSALIQQCYFPGWRVELNGVVIREQELSTKLNDWGLMTVSIPAGKSELLAYYDGPPGSNVRFTVMLISVLAFLLIHAYLHYRIKRVQPRSSVSVA